jgi:glucose/arabinose dehydrogenase
MTRTRVLLLVVLLAAWASPAAADVPPPTGLRARVIVSGLSQPLAMVQDPLDPDVQFIVQKGGRIRVLRAGTLEPADFLDLSGQVSTVSEQGLLGLAFPPDAAVSRRAFVCFTNLEGHTVVARYRRGAANPLVADTSSRFDLLWPGGTRYIVQPYTNHNGGTLRFGPDGYLYVGLGDGGGGDDPEHRAQDPRTLLGKMLRIDVSVPDGDPKGYAVPPDNPFVDNLPVDALEEIWAFGLRNPWKFSFDPPARGGTGGLFIGDVGQAAREEIDYEPPGSGGRNYGWRNREGRLPGAAPPLPPAYLPFTEPIHDYPRDVGTSVTGGYVYRGTALGSAYLGRYVFGDFVFRRVFSLGLAYGPGGEASVTDIAEHTLDLGGTDRTGAIASIDVDADGELYLVDFRGTILKIEPEAPPALTAFTGLLQVGGPNTVTGHDFTSGSVVMVFVATASGATSHGPYTPTSVTSTSLTWTIPATVPLGSGYAAVQVVNTDEGYTVSNVLGELLVGAPTSSIPSILAVDGRGLAPAGPEAVAHVDTIVLPGEVVTLAGTGFSGPLVNLYSSAGNAGPLTPLAGASATSLQVQLPAGVPVGPGSVQVVNAPYSGNVQSNAVSVVVGAPVTITGVTVSAGAVTVRGTGFSALTVINLFNAQAGGVVNLGGFGLPVTVTGSTELTFTRPAGAVAGSAFVEVLNPPFIAFSSSGTDPDGAFVFP